MTKGHFLTVACACLVCTLATVVKAQTAKAPQPNPAREQKANAAAELPPGYVIGASDLLTVRFWGDNQLSADVVVRPDGKISVPLLNDVQASGFTPEQLGSALEKAASKFITEPVATVIVREIRSRQVFVLGEGVARAGIVPLNSEMTVLQVLAAAGGLLEYADKRAIVVLRTENGRERRFKFNYNDVVKGKNVQQNIVLLPGDTVLVP
jgi:polysaccharide export outer membrane protein